MILHKFRWPHYQNALFFLGLLICFFAGCSNPQNVSQPQGKRVVEDALGRKVMVTDSIQSLATMHAGALRLVCYFEEAGKVAYIERNEITRNVPYLFANPHLKRLPIAGAGNVYNMELLAKSEVDVIIATYMSTPDADKIQHQTGKPVFVLEYGDLVSQKFQFYKSVRALGNLLNKTSRADSLISFIEKQIETFNTLSAKAASAKTHTAYLGGVAYNGIQALESTRVEYPPFVFLNIHSPVEAVVHAGNEIGRGQKNTLVSLEQVLVWNPEYLFLDVSGKNLWQEQLHKPEIGQQLAAVITGKAWSVLPFNWHTINYENLIINSWFIGKTVYPQAFENIDIAEKMRETYSFFLGNDISRQMDSLYHPFQKIGP